jgi:hypothetical protein
MRSLRRFSRVAALLVLSSTTAWAAGPPKGWYKAGSKPQDYAVGVEKSMLRGGSPCAYLRSTAAEIEGFGTLMQTFDAKNYRGKRLRLAADVKSADVVEWAGLWMRVDGPNPGKSLAFDNMQDRPIKGSADWREYSVVLDVDRDAEAIAFGLLLRGTGSVWLANVRIEPVGKDTPTTQTQGKVGLPEEPVNLDFKQE